MQRINWFPNPSITGPVKPWANNNVQIDYLVVNNRNWIRVTSTATGDNFAVYALSGSQIPPSGSYHVHALAYAHGAEGKVLIYVAVGGSYSLVLNVPVGDGQTVLVDRAITIPANCDQMLVRICPANQTIGAKAMMTDILIERADTYDAAVGGGLPGFFTGDTMPRD